MNYPKLLLGLASLVLVCSVTQAASAQAFSNRIQPMQARTSYKAPSAPVAYGFGRRPLAKPFAHAQSRPTVSPYLNLTRDDSGSAANYQTLVRPQMEQLDLNRQQQIQLDRLGRQFDDFRAQSAYPTSGSENIRATGHITRFNNLSHFYPR